MRSRKWRELAKIHGNFTGPWQSKSKQYLPVSNSGGRFSDDARAARGDHDISKPTKWTSPKYGNLAHSLIDIKQTKFVAFGSPLPPILNLMPRVYLLFQCRNGWHCQFLEVDLKTSLPGKLHFASSQKIIELVEHAWGFTDQDARSMVNQGIEMGRDLIFLNLTDEQYAALRVR